MAQRSADRREAGTMSINHCAMCEREERCQDYLLCSENNWWFWRKIPCPACGGALSEIRTHNGKKYRHCYSCHFEFSIREDGSFNESRA